MNAKAKSTTVKNQRRYNRVPLAFPMRVEIRKNKDKVRIENTELVDVSPVGAGFFLENKVAVGELLLLKMPLPHNFRAHDFNKRDYCIWSVVRHCRFVKENDNYYVGTAFVGEKAPESFDENPLTLYRIADDKTTGFPKLIADGFKPESKDLSSRKPRYGVPINVYLAIYDGEGTITAHEQTVTENISRGGAAVFSVLPVKLGDKVSLMSEQYNISIPAEVCNIRTGKDGLPRLHLKFIGEKFPLHGIE